MIGRVWSAHATEEGVQQYFAHFEQNVAPQLQRIGGYRGVLLLCREKDLKVEIQVVTFWDTIDAIRQFASTDPNTAVVEEEARTVLQDYDLRVVHFEVMLDIRTP